MVSSAGSEFEAWRALPILRILAPLEIWGNPSNKQTQGKTLLLSREINPAEDFTYRTKVKPTSPFVRSLNYTATLTYGSQSSRYSKPVKSIRLDLPELDFAPTEGENAITVSENEVVLQWPAFGDLELFFLEEASSLAGPWRKVTEATQTDGGSVVVTVPLSEKGEQFFRLGINPSALKDLANSVSSSALNQP